MIRPVNCLIWQYSQKIVTDNAVIALSWEMSLPVYRATLSLHPYMWLELELATYLCHIKDRLTDSLQGTGTNLRNTKRS